MGVPYDVLNARAQDLTTAMLASSSAGLACKPEDAGCTGNYNGIILTDADLVIDFTPPEWGILHDYEKKFGVREAVLSGWPATYSDPQPPREIYLDYGLVHSSSGNDYEARWAVPAMYSKEVFEYVNKDASLPITYFAFAATPRNDTFGLRDGSVPHVEPILRTPNGEALISIVRYMMPSQTTPVREVMISTITNADVPHPLKGPGLRVHQLWPLREYSLVRALSIWLFIWTICFAVTNYGIQPLKKTTLQKPSA